MNRTVETVGLVATREITTTLRSKGFRILTAVVALAIVVAVVVFKFVAGHNDNHATVGLTAGESSLAAPLQSSAAALGQPIQTQPVDDATTGRAKVRDGSLDALLLTQNGQLHVVVKTSLNDKLHTVLNLLARSRALDQQITALGGNPATVNEAVQAARVSVEALSPPKHYDTARIVLGSIAGVLIYLSLFIQGQRVAQGVIEEKSSRVVEVLLASLRPWQLMTGKVLGIGVVGLIQMAIYGAVGIGLATGLGVLSISASAAAGIVVWLIAWYLLGYFLYAFVCAAAGALVSRQEDAAGVVMPVLLPVIGGYVLGISILPSDPGSTLCEVLSVIPVFAPTLMPMRLAMGGVPVWEMVLSVVLVIGAIPLLIWLSGVIYGNAVLRIGARVKLRAAVRS
ncbi:ABC transporter permease [Skermania sp. ID1734]|uniref:ABC transporter permease n=1 Tax=Skermania sp. ID1734 TaxID=2597516 RepID=UPI00117E882D|nr:ABC transporter permease [Skermania sp. ID1734]TSE00368.1 ABC transporter permease [Skermania sp. ID1734]